MGKSAIAGCQIKSQVRVPSMSDTIRYVSWALGTEGGTRSGRLRLSRRGRKTLDDILWETIEQEGWSDRLTSLFPVTSSLWHTFWMDSPLSPEQSGLLHDLFTAVGKRQDCAETGLPEFLNGLLEAHERQLPLFTTLAPPGHCDVGWITIFPHCPRCKSESPLPRWQESYPQEPIDCPVCGTTYSPAETYSSERYDG